MFRIAVTASGGLSHDIGNYRAGWVDEPFDRWVLEHLARGKGRDLQGMFDLEPGALRGGAAHVRMWAAVAGACVSLGSDSSV